MTKDIFLSIRFHALLAFVFSVLAVVIPFKDYSFQNYTGDSQGYMRVAHDLVTKGVFTDGHYAAMSDVQGPNGEGMFFAPLYPAMLAGILAVDKTFSTMVDCYMAHEETSEREFCPQDIGYLKIVQIVLAVISLFLVWMSAYVITGRVGAAWVSVVFASVAEAYAYYAGFIMTESLVFPLFTASLLLAVMAFKTGRLGALAGCGAMLGFLTLTRPSFIYMFYFVLVMFFIFSVAGKAGWKNSFRVVLFPLMGFLLVVMPWLIRNKTVFDELALTKGYAPFTLEHRVAFNGMSDGELRASFIYGLPDFGDSLAKKIFVPEDYMKLEYGNPDGYYMRTTKSQWERVNKGEKPDEGRLSEIIQQDIFGNFYQHILVTFSLVWRGMWVSKYWGLVTIPVFAGVFAYAVRRRWTDFLIFLFPPWFMLGFHGFTSINVVRYNLILIPCLAIAAAFLVMAGVDRVYARRGK